MKKGKVKKLRITLETLTNLTDINGGEDDQAPVTSANTQCDQCPNSYYICKNKV